MIHKMSNPQDHQLICHLSIRGQSGGYGSGKPPPSWCWSAAFWYVAGDNSYEAADNSFEVDEMEGGVRAACIFLLWFEGATACSPENAQIRCDPTKYFHGTTISKDIFDLHSINSLSIWVPLIVWIDVVWLWSGALLCNLLFGTSTTRTDGHQTLTLTAFLI